MNSPSLVTGGCGFVGRHVVLRLLKMGHDIWIVDDLSTGIHPDNWLKNVTQKYSNNQEYFRYQIGNQYVHFAKSDVRRFLREYFTSNESILLDFVSSPPTFGDVIHLSSIVGGRAIIDGNPMKLAEDLALDAEFFVWAIKATPKRILYASSSAAYPIDLQGENNSVALKEDMITFGGKLGQPDMTYGWSKLTGEYLSQIASKHYGLSVACIRPFSGYGGDQDTTYPIPAIAQRAVNLEDPLIIWGSGNQGRDFIHIEDCIDGMFLAMNSISDGSAVNLGSGKLTTFKEVAKLFATIAGYNPIIKPLKDMPTGVHSRYADTSYSYKTLNWQPQISIEQGFKQVFEEVKKQS